MATILKVEGMSCEHCVKAVTNALETINGVSGVAVDLAGKTVTVRHEPSVDVAALKAAVEEQGYDVLE